MSTQYASGGPPTPPGTLNELFFSAIAEYDKPDALQVKVSGTYSPISHREIERRVRHAALGLKDLGIQPGDRVALLSPNRPEWAIFDYACLTSGVTDVPIYPTLPADQIAYVLRDAGAVAVVVADAEQAMKIASVRSSLTALKHVISFDDAGEAADMTLAELEQRGEGAETPETVASYRQTADAVKPDDLATLIYTSGTTGEPKGVMLTHYNIRSNVDATRQKLPFPGNDVSLSFLPLSHIFQRTGDYLMFATGTSIAYAENFDTVPVNLMEVGPTIVFSVPRLYEKMYARVLQNALAGGVIKKKIFFWARGVADKWADVTLAGGQPSGMLSRKYALAQKLVFSKLKQRTGGHLRYFVSGGAQLAPEINRFFYSAGLTILEGYGLTETSPVIGVNTPEDFRIGTIGKPLAGVEVMIAGDGEILTRGPSVMKGYFNKPEATAEAIDREGWFHTGDIGEIHDDFITITDRKKDIIVTAGGTNIAPQPIENMVKTNKFVSQAVMLGDRRRFPSMLIVPNFDHLEEWAKKKGLLFTDRSQLIRMPAVIEKMDSEVLPRFSGLAHYERPKKIGLLAEDFSLERGEMTPKQSVKRKVVDQNYKNVIDAIYAE
ncbi:MAG: long-chain fatty acid--CoA ligase [Gemmatimonadaceae bacterium]